jgi:hypothetical protein
MGSYKIGTTVIGARTAGFLDARPQVLRDTVGVQVLLQVYRDALQERLLANKLGEHAQY